MTGEASCRSDNHSLLVKRVPSFDYAQDGEAVEPYLANKDMDTFFPSHDSRATENSATEHRVMQLVARRFNK